MSGVLTPERARCAHCGGALPADSPEGLCGACLMSAGAETLTTGSLDDLPTITAGGAGQPGPDAPRIAPGATWGGYRIGRLLGRGGMGEVYEAEHIDFGRRVALKVLRSRLQNRDERARFLLEGQLAASVSHPHTVYIFGSEEIAGSPVISMELLPGGTLKDRVAAEGPLAPREAVAAILDIVGGLDAANAAGILHRDIKPSNCFVDADGTVKVGDFGLSISTLARDVRSHLGSSFEGTPQFAPPEQLRGEPLDVRADIYAVGGTLYYLLTGRPPFEAADLPTLVGRVTSEPAQTPRAFRREIPPRLAAVVLQCLAKNPADRPASYSTLADALRPFSARDDVPAGLGTRTLAGIFDSWIIVGLPAALVMVTLGDPLTSSSERTSSIEVWMWTLTALYYLALEGRWSASLAKRLLGLRVVSADGSTASWRQIAARTGIFYLPHLAWALAVTTRVVVPDSPIYSARTILLVALTGALFFSTARRANGWTGLHDVVSGTRVVARPARATRVRQGSTAPAPPAGAAAEQRFGPFVTARDADSRNGAVVVAFDPVLRRRVWVRLVRPGTPPIDAVRRDLLRPARLHWLTGRRSREENWDAFEAPDGQPFVALELAGASWHVVKGWLLDLTGEMVHAGRDGTTPSLSADRLWIREDGRLVLLEFPGPGTTSAHGETLSMAAVLARVGAVAAAGGDGSPSLMPLSARAMVARWSAGVAASPEEEHEAMRGVGSAPDSVDRRRRAMLVAVTASPVALLTLLGLLLTSALSDFNASDENRMLRLLGVLTDRDPDPASPVTNPEVRRAMEVVVAGRYGSAIRREEFWSSGVMRELADEYREPAEAIVRSYPSVTASELAAAEKVLAASRPPGSRPGPATGFELAAIVASTLGAFSLGLVIVCSVVSSLISPGGVILRSAGLALVTRTGDEATRGRAVLRVLVAAAPGLVWLVYLAVAPRVQGFVPVPPTPLLSAGIALGLLGAGAIWTIAGVTRGPHDRVVGTWVVPR